MKASTQEYNITVENIIKAFHARVLKKKKKRKFKSKAFGKIAIRAILHLFVCRWNKMLYIFVCLIARMCRFMYKWQSSGSYSITISIDSISSRKKGENKIRKKSNKYCSGLVQSTKCNMYIYANANRNWVSKERTKTTKIEIKREIVLNRDQFNLKQTKKRAKERRRRRRRRKPQRRNENDANKCFLFFSNGKLFWH